MLVRVPDGIDAVKQMFGDPDPSGIGKLDMDWFRENIESFALPFPVRLSWDEGTQVILFQAHRLVGDLIVDAMDEIGKFRGSRYLEENRLNLWGGTFNFRNKTGRDDLSTHAFGIAADVNPHLGPFGEEPNMPSFIVKAFKSRGFVWGGDWEHPYTDGMHFQYCSGY